MVSWSAGARRARGLTVAIVGLGLALTGHVLGGGSLFVEPWMVLPMALGTSACVLASSRVWSLIRLLGALAGLQIVVHTTLWLASGPPAAAPGSPLLASHHHAPVTGAQATVTTLLGHALAVAVTALVLRRGEQVLVLLWTGARNRLRLAHPVLPAPLGSGFASVGDRTSRLVSATRATADLSRAPPRSAVT